MNRAIMLLCILAGAGITADLVLAQQPKAPSTASPQGSGSSTVPQLADCSRVRAEQLRQCEELRKAQLECRSAPDFRACVRSKM
jgi:hypothetical protein